MTETKRHSNKVGLPPGTLLHIGKHNTDKIRISVIDYNKDSFFEKECNTIEESFDFKDNNKISWINIDGLHDIMLVQKIGDNYGLHPLLLEDILNTEHRPKLEEFDNYLFVTLKMLGINKSKKSINSEQVSFILGKNWLISFQEKEGDLFDTIRKRISESKGNIRFQGADYLLYRLIDTIVDHYFIILDELSDSIGKLESKVLKENERENLIEIQKIKSELRNFKKIVTPLREAIGNLTKDVDLIQENTKRYLRDVYEHVISVNDSIDSQREILSGILELYNSGVSNKMNQVMQLLTIISTIFIPLTFIAGIYGMNFDNIPELHWENGYFIVWGFMFVILIIMLVFFKRKRWL